MRCSNCGADNAADARFCNQCATRLAKLCTKCASENAPEARFCSQCAAPLTDHSTPPIADSAPARSDTVPREGGLPGERRHLTVLFCDLVGSTALAAQLDPEEWQQIIAGYQRSAADAITRYSGHVAKFLGDGVMAFFGYPEAHDDDAERAARAGLAIVDAISKLDQPERTKLTVRVGIDSGSVVVGAGAGKQADVFGDTPNIAARVQAAAEPGTVLITAATHRLVSGLFVVEERGAQTLRGIVQPLDLYRVIRPSGMRGRFAATAAVRGMTRFINREEELRLLMNRWERAREGEGQVVTIVGEAGIGKSRLVQHFQQEIAADPHTWLECTTAAFFRVAPAPSAWRQISAVVDGARASTPAAARHRGGVDHRIRESSTAGDGDRRFALGGPVDAGIDSTCGRAVRHRTVDATAHHEAGVPHPVAAAGVSYTNHSQPAERPQRAHNGRPGGGTERAIRGYHQRGGRAHQRSTVVRRRVDTGGSRT